VRQGVLAASLFIAWYEMWTEIQGNLAIFGQFLARVRPYSRHLWTAASSRCRAPSRISVPHTPFKNEQSLFF